MKKAVFVLLIILVAGYNRGQVSVGIAAGGNICKINQSIDYNSNPDILEPDERDLKPNLGFSVGIPIEFSFSEKLSLFSMPGYLQKGTGMEMEYQESDYTTLKVKGYIKYNYLELPVLLRYHFINHRVGVNTSVGPSFGYLVNATSKYKTTIIDTEENTSETATLKEKVSSDEIKDMGVNRLDISLSVGIGFDYQAGKGKFFLNFNYLYGFSNMMKGAEIQFKNIKQRNRGVNFMAGYLIPLGN